MPFEVITERAIEKRRAWIKTLSQLSGDFVADTGRIQGLLESEIRTQGNKALRDHLRLCGVIPESYGHDSSEEKLYSKYTDVVLSLTFRAFDIRSQVLTERADAADVECWADEYEFVADAKAFRLSRTAKNQKDFKVQAMHGWKRGRHHAMVVCPLFQLPSRSSQIYLQAISQDVCLFSFSHLAALTALADQVGTGEARSLLKTEFKVVDTIHPAKDAVAYWMAINRTMLAFAPDMKAIWQEEKVAAAEALQIGKEEGLTFLSEERRRILALSHDEALAALIQASKIDERARTIQSLGDNGLMEVE